MQASQQRKEKENSAQNRGDRPHQLIFGQKACSVFEKLLFNNNNNNNKQRILYNCKCKYGRSKRCLLVAVSFPLRPAIVYEESEEGWMGDGISGRRPK